MKKIIGLLVVLLIIMGGVMGCSTDTTNSDDKQPQEEQQDISKDDEDKDKDEVGGQDSTADLNFLEGKEGTILIEGMKEDITLYLLDGRANGFITYIPENFIVEAVSSGEGDAYNIFSNFGGVKREDVYIRFFFFSDTLKEKPVLVGEKGILTASQLDMQKVTNGEKNHNWSIEEYISRDGETLAALGNHEGQYFLVTISYPVEFGDGVVPRIRKILDEFYWLDTETHLVENN